MNDIRKLEPKEVWNYFHEITQIPRPSKKEKKIAEFVVKFAKDHNLEVIVDKVGNVLSIGKRLRRALENRKVV